MVKLIQNFSSELFAKRGTLRDASATALYDSLHVSGRFVLDGASLSLSSLGGFTPANADRFVIATAAEIVGCFSNAAESIRVGSTQFQVTYLQNMVVLGNATAVPEPATIGMAFALAWHARLATRRRRARCVDPRISRAADLLLV